ncbi:MAG: TraB/GumN family protein [Kofleriaceae bacterium]
MRALALLVIASCASAPRCELPAKAAGAPFLWKVHKPGGAIVWLYGTIHVAGIAAVPASAIAALDSAQRFASELGDVEPDADKVGELARLPFGQVLDQLLPADDWYDLVDAMRGTMKEDDLRHARPWFAMTRLTLKLAPSPKPSMDDALTDHAKDHHLAVDHLETWDAQMQALVDGVNVADLQQAIHLRNTLGCEVDKMRALYDNGDAISLEPLLVPRDQATIIDARNAKWQVQIETYAASGGAFIAVGLGHLLGDHGLVAVFGRAGYSVERAERHR